MSTWDKIKDYCRTQYHRGSDFEDNITYRLSNWMQGKGMKPGLAKGISMVAGTIVGAAVTINAFKAAIALPFAVVGIAPLGILFGAIGVATLPWLVGFTAEKKIDYIKNQMRGNGNRMNLTQQPSMFVSKLKGLTSKLSFGKAVKGPSTQKKAEAGNTYTNKGPVL